MIDENFNWVRARSQCSLPRVFAMLGEIVDSDVKALNAAQPSNLPAEVKRYTGKIVVAHRDSTIVFELTGGIIQVRQGPEHALFSAKLRLDEDGECLLEVNGRGLKLWQVSRKALEDLFFG